MWTELEMLIGSALRFDANGHVNADDTVESVISAVSSRYGCPPPPKETLKSIIERQRQYPRPKSASLTRRLASVIPLP